MVCLLLEHRRRMNISFCHFLSGSAFFDLSIVTSHSNQMYGSYKLSIHNNNNNS